MKNLAIVGGFAAGKTTLADALIAQGYTRVSFAKRLKELAKAVYGEPIAEYLGGGREYAPIDKVQEYSVTRLDDYGEFISGRQLLQELGQAVKALDRDFWIKWMLRDIRDGKYGPPPFVTDDCRFPYEANALSAHDFVIIGLVVPQEERIRRYTNTYGRAPSEAELNHPSETELADIYPDALFNGMLPKEKVLEQVLEFLNG